MKVLAHSAHVNSACMDLYERKLFAISGTNGPARGHLQWKRGNRGKRVEESLGSSLQVPLRPRHDPSLPKAIPSRLQHHPLQKQKALTQQVARVLSNSSSHLHFLPASGWIAGFCNALQSEYIHIYIPSFGNVQSLGDLDNFGEGPILKIWTS